MQLYENVALACLERVLCDQALRWVPVRIRWCGNQHGGSNKRRGLSQTPSDISGQW